MNRILLTLILLFPLLNVWAWQQERMRCYMPVECIFSENVEVQDEAVDITFRHLLYKQIEHRVKYTFEVKEAGAVAILFDDRVDYSPDPEIRLDTQTVEVNSIRSFDIPFSFHEEHYDSIRVLLNMDKQAPVRNYSYYLQKDLPVGEHTLELHFFTDLSRSSEDGWINEYFIVYSFQEADLRPSTPSFSLQIDASAIKQNLVLEVGEERIPVTPVYTRIFEEIPEWFVIAYTPEINLFARVAIFLQPFVLILFPLLLVGWHILRIYQYRKKNFEIFFSGIVYKGVFIPFVSALLIVVSDHIIRLFIGKYAAPDYWNSVSLSFLLGFTIFIALGYLLLCHLFDQLLRLYFRKKN